MTRTGGSDVDVSKRERTLRSGWKQPGLTALALALCLRAAFASPPPVPTQPSPPAAAASTAPAAAAASGAPSSNATASASQGAVPSPAASSLASPRVSPPLEEGPREWIHGEDINWGRQITSTLVWLLLMCGAIWLILRFMYGRVGAGMLGLGGRRSIQILERQFLGPQKALLTVRVGEKVLLLGMTDHTITTLAELSADSLDALGVTLVEPFGPPRGGERPASSEPPPDNLVDIASLFGRRGAQPSKGDDRE